MSPIRRFQSRAVNAQNQLISAANVTVYLTGTQILASLFSGEGLTALPNPFKSDHLGVFEFYVEGGDYDFDIADSISSRRYRDISIFDARDLCVLKSGDTMVGPLRVKYGTGQPSRFLASNNTHLGVGSSLPVTPDFNSGVVATIDETSHILWFYAKESGGALKSGSLTLS